MTCRAAARFGRSLSDDSRKNGAAAFHDGDGHLWEVIWMGPSALT
jgi:predicted lactoylglutathione lyase